MSNKTVKGYVDKPKRLGLIITSIPAKPLVQTKLKCGGFFIALTRAGSRA
jgi:hypothetical protein